MRPPDGDCPEAGLASAKIAAEQTLQLAEEKVRGENLVRQALAGGMSTTEAFKKYGIL